MLEFIILFLTGFITLAVAGFAYLGISTLLKSQAKDVVEFILTMGAVIFACYAVGWVINLFIPLY